MSEEPVTVPCVGGPLNGQCLPIPVSGEIVFYEGKYIYTAAFGHRTGECWVWHKFIR